MKEEDEHGRKRSERTLRNYFMDLADISLTGHTRLRKYGYFPDISFDSYNSVDDSNQTYCMPFSLMMSVWEGLITELDAEISDFDFDGFSRLCAIINGFYDSPYYTSMLEARKEDSKKHTGLPGRVLLQYCCRGNSGAFRDTWPRDAGLVLGT
uniref:Uncharacterized protein n=2 Tax=Klebsiella pneumoniae TaxID=573 RepID=A0A7M1I0N6_KLEPN|nr:hypothetical protein PMIDBGBA_05358 [Klebsiella pneumoniae]